MMNLIVMSWKKIEAISKYVITDGEYDFDAIFVDTKFVDDGNGPMFDFIYSDKNYGEYVGEHKFIKSILRICKDNEVNGYDNDAIMEYKSKAFYSDDWTDNNDNEFLAIEIALYSLYSKYDIGNNIERFYDRFLNK